MTKFDHESEDLIDLGIASVETRGNITNNQADDSFQHKLVGGLAAD